MQILSFNCLKFFLYLLIKVFQIFLKIFNFVINSWFNSWLSSSMHAMNWYCVFASNFDFVFFSSKSKSISYMQSKLFVLIFVVIFDMNFESTIVQTFSFMNYCFINLNYFSLFWEVRISQIQRAKDLNSKSFISNNFENESCRL